MVLIKKKKKLSPEEIEAQKKEKELQKSGIQDEFQAKGFELVEWAQEHKPLIIAGIGLIALALLAWGGSTYLSSGTRVAASADYEAALAVLSDQGKPVQRDGKIVKEEGLRAFEELSKKYAGTGIGKLADLHVGDLAFELKDGKKAVAAYQRALKLFSKDDPLRQVAALGLAGSYEADEEPSKALEVYESILESSVKIDEPMVLWQAQRLARKTGQEAKANAFAARLVDRHGSSRYANQAYVMPSNPE